MNTSDFNSSDFDSSDFDSSDFYKILSINKNATNEEIKKAYRKKILIFHPDKNSDPQASEKFQKIRIAYQFLSDQKQKKYYDNLDKMENSSFIKHLFMVYQLLVSELCDKYSLPDSTKQEIIELFNPADFKKEIIQNDFSAANKKLGDKIYQYIQSYIQSYIGSSYLNFATQYVKYFFNR